MVGQRYTKHKMDASSGAHNTKNWYRYMSLDEKVGIELLKHKNDLGAQLDIIANVSTEPFIKQVIDDYMGDPSWQPMFEQMIESVIDVTGARLKDEDLKAKEFKRSIKVTDGVKVKKRVKFVKNKAYEKWSPRQELFIKQRLKVGKTPKEIFKEYNYSKSFEYGRSKSSVQAKIRRMKKRK